MTSLTTDHCPLTTTPAPLIVVSGPSGSGKTTLVRQLVHEPPWPLRLSISATTRKKRGREIDGVHYHFWTRERFDAEVAAGAFLEWADNFGSCYGTLRSEVDPYRSAGTGVLLEIDVKGWAQVRAKVPDATAIFIRTSSIEVLERRLRERHTESEEAIQRRLAGARAELAEAHNYHRQVVNDDLPGAQSELRTIIASLFARN
jgi:guanylate kinase